MWSTSDGTELKVVGGDAGGYGGWSYLRLSHDGLRLLSCACEGTVATWTFSDNFDSFVSRSFETGLNFYISPAAFSSNGDRVVIPVSDRSRSLRVLLENEDEHLIAAPDGAKGESLAIAANENRIVVSYPKRLVILNSTTNEEIAAVPLQGRRILRIIAGWWPGTRLDASISWS